MKICLNFKGEELGHSKHLNFNIGVLSYIADGDFLYMEKLSSPPAGDVMIVLVKNASRHVATPIYDECKKRGFRAVFLDTENACAELSAVAEELSRQGLSVFCPANVAKACKSAFPVAECAVSGGSLLEYLELLMSKYRPLSLSLSRNAHRFDMGGESFPISRREVARLIDIYEANVFYSPAMMINYFIFSQSPKTASYVLFDDAHSLSEKIRLAKKLGVSDLFITYGEIEDIISNICF